MAEHKKHPRKGKPYVWVSWVKEFLAGDARCQFQLWFRAHYQYDKLEDGSFDLAKWKGDHDTLVQAEVARLRVEGCWNTSVEDANKFKLEGQTAILAGCPDVVALNTKDSSIVVVDGKTGKKRNSDWHQVLMYLFAWPKLYPLLTPPTGRIVYPTIALDIPRSELSGSWLQTFAITLRMAGSPTRPAATPSANECGKCDIPKNLCPERIEAAVASAKTDAF